jgi:hypothetical protein
MHTNSSRSREPAMGFLGGLLLCASRMPITRALREAQLRGQWSVDSG